MPIQAGAAEQRPHLTNKAVTSTDMSAQRRYWRDRYGYYGAPLLGPALRSTAIVLGSALWLSPTTATRIATAIRTVYYRPGLAFGIGPFGSACSSSGLRTASLSAYFHSRTSTNLPAIAAAAAIAGETRCVRPL